MGGQVGRTQVHLGTSGSALEQGRHTGAPSPTPSPCQPELERERPVWKPRRGMHPVSHARGWAPRFTSPSAPRVKKGRGLLPSTSRSASKERSTSARRHRPPVRPYWIRWCAPSTLCRLGSRAARCSSRASRRWMGSLAEGCLSLRVPRPDRADGDLPDARAPDRSGSGDLGEHPDNGSRWSCSPTDVLSSLQSATPVCGDRQEILGCFNKTKKICVLKILNV